jgi:hypothetical protein
VCSYAGNTGCGYYGVMEPRSVQSSHADSCNVGSRDASGACMGLAIQAVT